MTPSDTQTRSKRVRVDPTATTIPDHPNASTSLCLKVPKARASAAIAAHTATLLPQLSTILQTLGDKHLDLLHRHYNKSTQLRRMEPDDTIIPRSARLKFELSVPKCIEELPDFLTLKEECASDIDKMKLSLKQHVISALKIEIKFYTAELKEHLATVLHTTTAAMLIANGNANVNAHRAVAHLISAHHAELFKHVTTNAEEYKQVYTKKHALTSFPSVNALATTTLTPDTNSASRFFTQPSQTAPLVTLDNIPQLDLIARTICCIFIDPFDQYLAQHRANAVELALKKLVEEDLTVSATADAQMEVEEEDSASRVLLNELVQKETRKNTTKLSSEIESLKQMIKSLKGQRGPQPTRGASSKRNASKPKTKTSTPTKVTRRNAATSAPAKVDGRGSATSIGNKNNAVSRKKKSGKKKKPTSKTGKSK